MTYVKRFALLLLLLAFLAPSTASAQVSVGISGGLSLATVTGDDVEDDDVDSRTGILVGGFASFPLSDIISFTSGLYYVQKGAKSNEFGGDATFKFDYLEVPLLLQVGLFDSGKAAVSVFAGPAVAFEIGCKAEASDGTDSESIDCDSDPLNFETKSLTFDAIFGAGVRIMTSETMFFLANGGLDMGLTSIDDSADEDDVKNSSWFLQAGFGWILGG
jgi:hypothetical protein